MGFGKRPRRGFTPEAIENIRHRYLDTEETQTSIAKDFGVSRRTIDDLVQSEGWPQRKDRVARDLPPDLKLRIEADRAVIAAIEETDEAAPLTVAERLERAAEKELAALERARVTLGLEPSSMADAERAVRTIERLTETLFKVRRLRVPDDVARGEVPATTERDKISFNQINKDTGNRVRYRKVDEETGEEVESANIIKGYQIDKGQYVEISEEELEAIALESKKTIEIDEFVPKSEIDELYNVRPYYIAPDGDVGQEAFVVIRDVIEKMNMVAIGRVVLSTREHVIAMEPRGKGIMGTLLRYPYEVRDENEYFDDIKDVKISKDMMQLAEHIVKTKSGHFKPEAFEDQYEAALREIIEKKSKGIKIEAPRERTPSKVINLMDALRNSVRAEQPTKKAKRGKKRIEGQREMLFPIAGKKTAKQEAKRATRSSTRRKVS
jgi:DNA end-binding protein Ku